MASEVTVGLRELKTHLSRYIKMAKAGETVIVTERGTPVIRLQPVGQTVRERLLAAAEAGILRWNGEDFNPPPPTVENRGSRTVADLLLEDRE